MRSVYSAFTGEVQRNCHFPASSKNCYNVGKLILLLFFLVERCLTRIGETLKRLVNHAVSAGNREVAVKFNFISERAVAA
jgi:hypothetical protein